MKIISLFLLLTLVDCSSRSLTPDKKDVVMSREAPSSQCKEMGKIVGTTASVKGTAQQAMDDLATEAANKGANFVWIKEYSANQTTVTAFAYECP